MTLVDATPPPPADSDAPRGPLGSLSPGQRVVLLGLGGVLLLSFVRAVGDAPELTSSGTWGAALRLAVPIGLAALGGLYAERSGIVNIGLEGMMILGTWFGAYGAWEFGPWWGVALGLVGGMAGGLLHALATVTFGVDQIVSGVAINILGAGIARYLSVITYDESTGGGAVQSPQITEKIGTIDVPLLAGGAGTPDVLGWIDRQDWFFLSDLAGILRGFTSNLSWFTLLAVLLFPFTAWLLWRTRFGLRMRSVGENPAAAESLGVNVYRFRYAGVMISGAMAGLAGAFLALVASNLYREGQTGGRGFIGLAAMIFGNWNPFGAAAGAGLFGFADALNLRSNEAIQALLLFVAILAGIFAIRSAMKGQKVAAIVGGLAGVAFLVAWLVSEEVPRQFVGVTPHIVTLLVLAFATQRLRPPAAEGKPYRKGEAH